MTSGTPRGARDVLWTIGHSTRPVEDTIALLRANGIRAVADVRAFPASRRHPQYGREAFRASLAEAGIGYAWLGAPLGGRRSGAKESRNVALRVAAFRAYADHMASDEFRRGVEALLALAREAPTAYLCAEALWWRCHRALISDHLALVVGARVLHVMDAGAPTEHRPRPEARVEGDRLVYDGRAAGDASGEGPLFEAAG